MELITYANGKSTFAQHLATAQETNLLNSLLATRCWGQKGEELILANHNWSVYVTQTTQDIELIRPAGTITKTDVTKAIDLLKQQRKDIWIYGVGDDTIDCFDKANISEVALSYIHNIQHIRSLTHKELRNAVTKAQKTLTASALTPAHEEEIRVVTARWKEKTLAADTHFHEQFINNYLARTSDYQGIIVYRDDTPVGWAVVVQDCALKNYACLMISCQDKTVNGATEFLLYHAAKIAHEHWGATLLNTGGADPKEQPGLHAHKKKFGYDHVIAEYTLLYKQ